MGIERRVEVIPASGRIEAARGNFFLLLAATAAVNLRLDSRGTSEGFNNVTGGLRVQRIVPWDTALILGAAGTSVEYIVGAEAFLADNTDVFLQVATVAGTVAVADNPAAAVADIAPVVRATATQGALFAANLLRRRITVHVDSANAGSCFARTAGGANNIAELQPGVTYTFEGRYALDVRNDTGFNCTFYIFEES